MTLVFCSLSCWESHQADARHRDAGAMEARSPTAAAWAKEQSESEAREAERKGPSDVSLQKVKGLDALETLVVASKLKDYIRERADMSTSDRVLGVLSDHLRSLSDHAILAAGKDGRRTAMDRDYLPLVTKGTGALATGAPEVDDRPAEVLVVVTKLKAYVKARGGMNTSDSVVPVLSAYLRRLARKAIRIAGADDRKTVLDRDVLLAIEK